MAKKRALKKVAEKFTFLKNQKKVLHHKKEKVVCFFSGSFERKGNSPLFCLWRMEKKKDILLQKKGESKLRDVEELFVNKISSSIEFLENFSSSVTVLLGAIRKKAETDQERVYRRVTFPLIFLKFSSIQIGKLLRNNSPLFSSASSSVPSRWSPSSLATRVTKFLQLLRSKWTSRAFSNAIQLSPSIAKETLSLVQSLAEELIGCLSILTQIVVLRTNDLPPISFPSRRMIGRSKL